MNRRGVAMVMVLGATVVLLTAAAGIARSRADRAIRERSGSALTMGLAVADASEAPILAWLKQESRDAVVHPAERAPWLPVMDSELRVGDVPVRVTITAWDQHGMVPAEPEVAGAILSQGSTHAGWLDTDFGGLDQAARDARVFPSRAHPDRLGGVLATHSSAAGSRRGNVAGMYSLNLNTAPAWLLASAIPDPELVGRILAARESGEPADVARLGSGVSGNARLIGSSPAWAFRTDVEVPFARVSTWTVFVRDGGAWRREQRLVITD